MRSVLTVIGKYVALSPNPVHVELGYRSTYLVGICPFCLCGLFTVLLDEERWICRGCEEGGDTKRFLTLLILNLRTSRKDVGW